MYLKKKKYLRHKQSQIRFLNHVINQKISEKTNWKVNQYIFIIYKSICFQNFHNIGAKKALLVHKYHLPSITILNVYIPSIPSITISITII